MQGNIRLIVSQINSKKKKQSSGRRRKTIWQEKRYCFCDFFDVVFVLFEFEFKF